MPAAEDENAVHIPVYESFLATPFFSIVLQGLWPGGSYDLTALAVHRFNSNRTSGLDMGGAKP